MICDVVWSADDDGVWIAKRHTTLLPLCDCMAPKRAAEKICRDYFTASVWSEWTGSDEDRIKITLTIHEPPIVSGEYVIDLQRKTVATAISYKEAADLAD